MKDKIKNWLESTEKDYSEGLALFFQSCKNRHLCNHLSRKQDMGKLIYELTKLSGGAVSVKPLQPVAQTEIIDIVAPSQSLSDRKIALNSAPEQIQHIFKEAISVYREARSLHEKLKLVVADVDRAGIVAQLNVVHDQYRSCWDAIDLWQETGELPIAKDDQPQSKPFSAENPPTAKDISAANTAVNRHLFALSQVKDDIKRQVLIDKLKKSVEVLQLAGTEFKQTRIDKLTEIGIL